MWLQLRACIWGYLKGTVYEVKPKMDCIWGYSKGTVYVVTVSLSPTFTISHRADMWVGLSYPGVGVPWNVVCSWNLARVLSTCYNNRYRRKGFNSARRQRQDTCKVETSLWFLTIFTNLAFYLQHRVWISMAPLFGQNGGGWFPSCNVKLALFGLTFYDSIR